MLRIVQIHVLILILYCLYSLYWLISISRSKTNDLCLLCTPTGRVMLLQGWPYYCLDEQKQTTLNLSFIFI